jgi:hypothetical protein
MNSGSSNSAVSQLKRRFFFQNFATLRPINKKLLDTVTETVISVVILRAVSVKQLDVFRLLPF